MTALCTGEMLAHELLPDSLTEPCMDVLKESAPSERELVRVIVEMIAELRDGEEIVDAVSCAVKHLQPVVIYFPKHRRTFFRTGTVL